MKKKSFLRHWRKHSFRGWEMVVLVASYSYLIYKIFTFDNYAAFFSFCQELDGWQFGWLLGVLALLPFNWLMETFKWRKLLSKVQPISLKQSIRAVLAGISTGFFTPNKIGELIGRVAFLRPEHRKSGITLSIVNSLTQNIVMAICGIPACMLFFTYRKVDIPDIKVYITSLCLGAIICVVVYFSLPLYSQRIVEGRRRIRISEFVACLATYSAKDLMEIILFSFFRYLIFCSQFYLMLCFFGVKLELWQALLTIPTSYLFVTFTPSVAFSEVAVRSSYAILFLGVFSDQVVNIALASMCVWIINLALPMLLGSYLLVSRKKLTTVKNG